MNGNFYLLWWGKIISQLGDKFYAIALAWWIVRETGSPSVMGLFLLASILPGILLGLFSGALADRFRRKTILIAADAVRGFLVLGVFLLSQLGLLQVWHIFLAGFLLSLATSFFDPASQAILPELVKKEDLKKANGMNQLVGGICLVAGPVLGSLAVGTLGLSCAFLANSASFFLSGVLACFIKSGRAREAAGAKTNLLADIREGILFLGRSGRISFVLKAIAMAHFLMGCLTVALPFLADGLKGGGVNALGLMQMMMGLGMALGSILLGMRKKAASGARRLLLALAAAGVCFLVIGVMQCLHVLLIPVYMVVMAAIGACIALASVLWQTILQNETPPDMTGRVFGVSTLTGNASLPIANALFGLLLNAVSLPALFLVCGLMMASLCGIFFLGMKKKGAAVEA